MRPILPALLIAVAFMALPGALAQSYSQLTLTLEAPEHALTTQADQLVIDGYVTFTGDILQYQHTSGIPVTYTVTDAPAWANVVVSPSTDTIPLPAMPHGPSFTAMRPVMVIVTLLPEYVGRDVQTIEVVVTQGAVMLGRPASAAAAVPVAVDARAEEPCAFHLGETILAQPPAEESAEPAPSDGVTVQTTRATPTALPVASMVTGGLALAGAGAGLALRRRFGP